MIEQQVAEPAVHEFVVRRLEAVVTGLAPGAGTLDWRLEPVDYAANSPTTAALYRLVVVESQPRQSFFVKLLQSYRQWPMLHFVPPEFRDKALNTDLWRYEADVYASGLHGSLPPGLRLPVVHSIDTLGHDHALLVLEDIPTSGLPWDADRFGRAAELLGRLNARLTLDDSLPATAERTPGLLTRSLYTGFIATTAVAPLLDESVWASPLMAAHADLRNGLAELARRAPDLLAALARRPQLMTHGDACPQNLLVPDDDPAGFVGVDWSPSGLVAAGDDLGQLLIGQAHSGLLAPEQLPALRQLVTARYTAGLAMEGYQGVIEADARFGLDGALALRSAFLSLPVARLVEPVTDELVQLFDRRLRLTRYLVELGLALPVDV